MIPRLVHKITMRLLLGLVLVVYAVDAAKKFEGSLRSAAEAPPQDNLAIESAAVPEVVAAPQEYKNPDASPPPELSSSAPLTIPETASGGVPPSAPSGISAPSAPANSLEECDDEMIGFELVTG